MQRADPSFVMGLSLLLAAKRIDELTDDYARTRLQALANDYRKRAGILIAGTAIPALHTSRRDNTPRVLNYENSTVRRVPVVPCRV